jgi:aromatic-L-amino-acid/L-tryptophan decarboxylase
VLNVCCFRYAQRGVDPQDQDALNRQLATRLQLDGKVVLSTTRLNERTFLRAAIVNHRTRDEDIDFAIAAVREACAGLGRR